MTLAIGLLAAVTWAMKAFVDWRTGAHPLEERDEAEVMEWT